MNWACGRRWAGVTHTWVERAQQACVRRPPTPAQGPEGTGAVSLKCQDWPWQLQRSGWAPLIAWHSQWLAHGGMSSTGRCELCPTSAPDPAAEHPLALSLGAHHPGARGAASGVGRHRARSTGPTGGTAPRGSQPGCQDSPGGCTAGSHSQGQSRCDPRWLGWKRKRKPCSSVPPGGEVESQVLGGAAPQSDGTQPCPVTGALAGPQGALPPPSSCHHDYAPTVGC